MSHVRLAASLLVLLLVMPPAVVAQEPSTIVDVREASDLLAVPSPDGRRVAFLVLGAPWVVDREGGVATPLVVDSTPPTDYFGFAWSPDSRRIAAWYWEGDPARRGFRILDPTGGSSFVVPEPRDLLGFGWDLRGERLLFATAEVDSTRIRGLTIADSSVTRVAATGLRARHVGFSGDGARAVLAVASGAAEQRGLWELELASGTLRLLVVDTSPARPAYSPDGDRVAYLSERGGERRARVVDVEDASLRPLGADVEDVHDAAPGWMARGDSVLFTAGGAIHVAAANGAGTTRSLPFTAPHRVARRTDLRHPELPAPGEQRSALGLVTPALSPDGARIVFGALGDLWVADTGGGIPRRLTRTPEPELAPRWSPDGGRIAYFATPLGGEARIEVVESDRGGSPGRIELPTAALFELDLAWHPGGGRLAYGATDLFNRELVVATIDLASGEVTPNHRARGAGGRLLGWTPDGEHVVHSSRSYDPVVGGYRHTFQRIAAATGTTEAWALPDTLALRSGWTPDLRRVAYSVAGRGYWRDTGDDDGARPGAPAPIADPAPRDFSWSADGRLLLYRTGSRLRLLDVDDGTVRDVPVDLRFDIPSAPAPVLIRGARVIDGTGAPRTGPRDILVEDGRIAGIAPPGGIEAPGVAVVEADGMTVLPGLINLHVHSSLGQARWSAFPYFGTTTVRDAGTEAVWMRAEAERMLAGEVGPRVFFAGGMVEHETGHGLMERPAVDRLDTTSVRGVIEGLSELGAAVVKVRIPDPVLDPLVARVAHEAGLPVTSHRVYPATLREGLEGKEHTALQYRETLTAPYQADVLDLLTAAGTCVSTTLMAAAHSLRLLGATEPDFGFPSGTVDEVAPFLSPAAVASLRRSPPPAAALRLRAQFETDVANAVRLLRSGGIIAAATDAGPLDPRLDLELAILVHGGLAPLEAIRAATLDAAHCLGLDHELGSVEVGKRADLLLVRGDPSTEIGSLGDIELVLLDGRVHRRADLLPSAGAAGGPE